MNVRLCCIGLCMMIVLPALLGSGPLVANNSDMLYVRGMGDLELVEGTLVYKHRDSETSEWRALYSRNQGSLKIELMAEPGTYQVETWSIASDPMNPQRVHEAKTVVIDGDDPGPGPYDIFDMLDLLAAWGPCGNPCTYDLNGDGVVDVFDLLMLLENWE